jgi:hypothetical protein
MLTESLREPWKAWKEQQQLDQHQHPSTDIYAAPLRVLPGNTSSDGTLDLIEHWLAEYPCNHSACVAARVNDREEILHGVRFLQITDPHTILLREDMVPYQYACLTHCWGGSEIIPKTTVANKAIHIERGLSVGSLPETFRETVHVCHRIGIDFVWIDSLCIVQDGDWDWRSQAARMADIYAESTLTIAAAKASDPTGGLFSDIDKVHRGAHLPGFTNVYVRKMTPENIFLHKRFSTLERRGWTYRELVLSPRIIRFEANQVSWEYRTA